MLYHADESAAAAAQVSTDGSVCPATLNPAVIPYRAVIIPIKKLSNAMTTSNPWMCVSGELGDSGVRQIPKNVLEMTFDVSAPRRPLGPPAFVPNAVALSL